VVQELKQLALAFGGTPNTSATEFGMEQVGVQIQLDLLQQDHF
jgi:hypothetical protein